MIYGTIMYYLKTIPLQTLIPFWKGELEIKNISQNRVDINLELNEVGIWPKLLKLINIAGLKKNQLPNRKCKNILNI